VDPGLSGGDGNQNRAATFVGQMVRPPLQALAGLAPQCLPWPFATTAGLPPPQQGAAQPIQEAVQPAGLPPPQQRAAQPAQEAVQPARLSDAECDMKVVTAVAKKLERMDELIRRLQFAEAEASAAVSGKRSRRRSPSRDSTPRRRAAASAAVRGRASRGGSSTPRGGSRDATPMERAKHERRERSDAKPKVRAKPLPIRKSSRHKDRSAASGRSATDSGSDGGPAEARGSDRSAGSKDRSAAPTPSGTDDAVATPDGARKGGPKVPRALALGLAATASRGQGSLTLPDEAALQSISLPVQHEAVRNLRVFLGLKKEGPDINNLEDVACWLGWALKQSVITQDALNAVLAECDQEVRLETKAVKMQTLFRYAVAVVLAYGNNTAL